MHLATTCTSSLGQHCPAQGTLQKAGARSSHSQPAGTQSNELLSWVQTPALCAHGDLGTNPSPSLSLGVPVYKVGGCKWTQLAE